MQTKDRKRRRRSTRQLVHLILLWSTPPSLCLSIEEHDVEKCDPRPPSESRILREKRGVTRQGFFDQINNSTEDNENNSSCDLKNGNDNGDQACSTFRYGFFDDVRRHHQRRDVEEDSGANSCPRSSQGPDVWWLRLPPFEQSNRLAAISASDVEVGCPGAFKDQQHENKRVLELRHICAFLPFTADGVHESVQATTSPSNNSGNNNTAEDSVTDFLTNTQIDAAAAALLALHHFNNGDGSIIPEVGTLSSTCPIRYTMEFFDSAMSPQRVSQELYYDILGRYRRTTGGIGHVTRHSRPSNNNQRDNNQSSLLWPAPTAMIGPLRSETTSPVAILNGIYSIPTLTFGSISTMFDNRDIYPSLIRTMAPVDGVMPAEYFATVLTGVHHVGVIYTQDAAGSSIARTFQEAAEARNITVVRSSLPFYMLSTSSSSSSRQEMVETALRPLVECGYRYFLSILFPHQLAPVMAMALEKGIAGPGYFWMVGSYSVASFDRTDPKLVQALNGSGWWSWAPASVFQLNAQEQNKDASDATTMTGDSLVSDDLLASRNARAFIDVWPRAMRDPELYSHLQTQLPDHVAQRLGANVLPFRLPPSPASMMMYDTVMTLLVGSCNLATNNDDNHDIDNPRDTPIDMTTSTHVPPTTSIKWEEGLYDSILQAQFDGCYGRVEFNQSSIRQRGSVPFTLENLLFDSQAANDSIGEFAIDSRIIYVYGGQRRHAANKTTFGTRTTDEILGWRRFRGSPDFIYSDGTTSPPDELPPVVIELVRLHQFIYVLGHLLSVAILMTSVGLLLWTIRHRNRVTVRAAQPSFLGLVCVGTFFMGLSLPILGFQEPMDRRYLDAACMANPWLFCIGFVVAYSALLSKLLRVNKLFIDGRPFRRQTVTASDVIGPFACLFAFNGALLVCWTMTAPLRYDRIPLASQDRFGRPNMFRGTCFPPEERTQHIAFVVLLFSVDLLVLVMATIQACKAWGIDELYSDSKDVLYGSALLLQAAFVDIPVPFLSGQARYIASCCFVTSVSAATLLLVFAPKIAAVRDEIALQEEILGLRPPTAARQQRLAATVGRSRHIHYQSMLRAQPSSSSIGSSSPRSRTVAATATIDSHNVRRANIRQAPYHNRLQNGTTSTSAPAAYGDIQAVQFWGSSVDTMVV